MGVIAFDKLIKSNDILTFRGAKCKVNDWHSVLPARVGGSPEASRAEELRWIRACWRLARLDVRYDCPLRQQTDSAVLLSSS